MTSPTPSKDVDNPAAFVSIVKDYPIILEKSCIPSIKEKRNKAVEEIQNKIEKQMGIALDSNKILKRFNNMKTRLKTKTDTNKTGNKKIVLKPWEEDLLKFIEGDSANPAIVRLKGAVTAGVNDVRNLDDSASYENPDHILESTSCSLPTSPSLKTQDTEQGPSTSGQRGVTAMGTKPPFKKRPKLCETDETKNLSLPELQRMVLLKQLEYFKKADELIDIKLKREKAKESQPPLADIRELDETFPDNFMREENDYVLTLL